MSTRTGIALLERVFCPDGAALTPETAKFFLSLGFRDEDQDRVDELSAKASAGTLTLDEKQELEDFIALGDFLAIAKSKARQVLMQPAAVG